MGTQVSPPTKQVWLECLLHARRSRRKRGSPQSSRTRSPRPSLTSRSTTRSSALSSRTCTSLVPRKSLSTRALLPSSSSSHTVSRTCSARTRCDLCVSSRRNSLANMLSSWPSVRSGQGVPQDPQGLQGTGAPNVSHSDRCARVHPDRPCVPCQHQWQTYSYVPGRQQVDQGVAGQPLRGVRQARNILGCVHIPDWQACHIRASCSGGVNKQTGCSINSSKHINQTCIR